MKASQCKSTSGNPELGTVVYEIITDQRVKFDVYQDFDPINTPAYFPRRDTLPSTKFFGSGMLLRDARWREDFSMRVAC